MHNLNQDSQHESRYFPYNERHRICRKNRTVKSQLTSCASGLFFAEVDCTAEAKLFDECKTKLS